MTHRFILAFLFLLTPLSTFADCESDLVALFSQRPDDADEGFVTDQVPINVETLSVG